MARSLHPRGPELNMTVFDRSGARVDEAAPELVLDNICKSFDGHVAVDRCDLVLKRGEIVALLGASGCGKSTLLDMVAGLGDPDYGTISLHGKVINAIPPYRRNVAMVFQHYAMFPHLTVADNIAYGLTARRRDKAEIAARVDEMVALLQLGGLEKRYPAQLSGGQRQRVAVARALAVRPEMLLLDEAFSALDRNLREDMQLELSLLLRRLMVTTVLVTHDQREAFALADRIAIMERGRIAQIGTPEDVYRKPGSSSVLRFLGTTNRFTANSIRQAAVSLRRDSIMELRNRMAPWLWLTPAGALLIPFFLIPILITARNSVYRDDPMGFLAPAFTFASYAKVLSDSYYLGVFGNTLVAAAVVSWITLVVAYPFAWLLARSSGSSRGFLLWAVYLPIYVSVIMRGFGWMVVIADSGMLNEALL